MAERRLILALAALLALGAAPRPAGPRWLMGYHDSWRERPATGPMATTLSALPGYVNLVALSFVKPDLVYPGGLEIGATGLSYQFSGRVLRDSIALLKRRQPGARVLLSVGGANNHGWSRLDEAAIARLVRDLGADGVDLDYEPPSPACAPQQGGRVACDSDRDYVAYVQRLRRVLPRPYILSVQGWSVGAYGEGPFRDAPPANGRYTGSMLGLLRSPAAALVDVVTIMAYDSSASYRPLTAFRAYRSHWRGPLLLGVQVGFRGAGGPNYGVAEVERLAAGLAADPAAGLMVYSLLEPPVAPASPATPNGRMLAQAACRGFRIGGCDVLAP